MAIYRRNPVPSIHERRWRWISTVIAVGLIAFLAFIVARPPFHSQFHWFDICPIAVVVAISFLAQTAAHSSRQKSRLSYELIVTSDGVLRREVGKDDFLLLREQIVALKSSNGYRWLASKMRGQSLIIPNDLIDSEHLEKELFTLGISSVEVPNRVPTWLVVIGFMVALLVSGTFLLWISFAAKSVVLNAIGLLITASLIAINVYTARRNPNSQSLRYFGYLYGAIWAVSTAFIFLTRFYHLYH